MLCANIINDQVILTNDIEDLATYDELMDELCDGTMKLPELTRVKDGIVIWGEEESEFDFVGFRN